MNDILENYLMAHKAERLRRRKTAIILCLLSVCAALTVVWQLRFVGITKSDMPCCGVEEHHHTSECYERRLVCTSSEAPAESASDSQEEGHIHTDACYEEILVCEKQEHEHTLSCYADPNADVETHEQWENTLPDLSDMRWGEKVEAIARSQLGYQESDRNYIVAEDGETEQGYTRYGEWYGSPYSDWSALFASFCLNYAGIPETAVPRNSDAYALRTQANEMGILVTEDFTPQIGDVLFMGEEGMEQPSRCAIVTGISSAESEDASVQVIEGDLNGAVQTNSYFFTDTVFGYISLEKAYERAVALELISPEEIPASPEPTEVPDASQSSEKTTSSDETLPTETAYPDTSAASEAPAQSSTLWDGTFNGMTEKKFQFENGLRLDVTLSGTIFLSEPPKCAMEPLERVESDAFEGLNKSEGREVPVSESSFGASDLWDNINLTIHPVPENSMQAFTEYTTANYPDAKSLTLMKFDCLYGDESLNTDSADTQLSITAAFPQEASISAADTQYSDGLCVQNAPIAESQWFAEPSAAEIEQNPEAVSDFGLIILKQDAQGNIEPVAEMSSDQAADGLPIIDFRGVLGENYGVIQTEAKNEKPILNHPQWPDQWGEDMRNETVDQSGNVIAPQFTLYTDPYFNGGIAGGSEDDYPKPELDLGYVLSNYNFFIFDDAVATNHLVGSAAIQGNTYITKQLGGSGGGYIQIPNKAPSYFKGRIIKLSGTYDGTQLTRQELDPAGLQLNISDTGHQTQVLWYSAKETVQRFPTYFGSANKANQDIVIKGDSSADQRIVNFPDTALTGGGTAAFKSTPDGGCIYSPYYYADQYIQFEEFRTQLLASDALHPKGISITKPTDLSDVPLISDWQSTDDQLKRKGYQWMKNDEGQLKLFVRMGNIFNVDDLENVQIILYPWQGLEEFPGEPELSSNPADRANWLCTQKINTVIQCDRENVHLATSNAQGTVIPSVAYYTGDLKGPFNPKNTTNASLFNSEAVSTSSMLLFPNAKEVSVGLSATHVVAPQASVYVPKSDYYGCFVCEDLRSCADHHILPYDTNSTFQPIVCGLSKMIDTGTVDENGVPVYRVPNGTEEETFRFKIRPYGFFRREATDDKSDRFSSDAAAFPYEADFQLQKEYLVTNKENTIDIDVFITDINRYFEQLVRELNGAASAADKSLYKGYYIFEVTEVPDTSGFIPDPNKYYIGIELCHNEAWGYDATSLRYQDILQKPNKFYGVENGHPVEKDGIVFYNKQPPFIPELPSTGGSGSLPYWFVGIALSCPLLCWRCQSRKKRH